jgi:hypothetical protein
LGTWSEQNIDASGIWIYSKPTSDWPLVEGQRWLLFIIAMKRLIPSLFVPAIAGYCLQAGLATAGYVVPRVPAPPIVEAQPPDGPNPLSTVWTVTSTADSGAGSLRQAISNAAPGDVITFHLDCPSPILLLSSLEFAKDLTIANSGWDRVVIARADGTNAPNFRIFKNDAGTVTLSGLILANGRATNTTGFEDNLGGAILNYGNLTVSNCVLLRNAALTTGNSDGFGGAIFTFGPLYLVNSTVRDNYASFAGGGVCTFHTTSLVVKGSTIANNFAGIQGGGVNFQGVTGLLQNSTLSGNVTPPDGYASALLNICFENEASALTLTACTITRNSGSTNGSVIFATVPGNLGQTNRMLSTVVADNGGPEFLLDGTPVLQSLGHNLDSDGTSGLVNGVNGDIVGTAGSPVDARLRPLQDNGGLTFTHAFGPGSPLLDAAACLDADGASLPIDQRGKPRPSGPACDIGALENQPPTVTCPPPRTNGFNCQDGFGSTLVAGVFDPDGDPLVAVWSVDGTPVRTNLVGETHPPMPQYVFGNVTLGNGTHLVTLTVSDGKAAPVSCSTTVTVRDTTPPRIISIRAVPNVLFPDDGRMVPVQVYVVAVDEGGPVTSRIVSVTSNQPSNTQDWVITGDLTLTLRASHDQGHDRIYTITVQASDPSGNKSFGQVTVTVPKKAPKPLNVNVGPDGGGGSIGAQPVGSGSEI